MISIISQSDAVEFDGQFATANALAVDVQSAADVPDFGIHSLEIEFFGPWTIEGRFDFGELIDVLAKAVPRSSAIAISARWQSDHGGRIGDRPMASSPLAMIGGPSGGL